MNLKDFSLQKKKKMKQFSALAPREFKKTYANTLLI